MFDGNAVVLGKILFGSAVNVSVSNVGISLIGTIRLEAWSVSRSVHGRPEIGMRTQGARQASAQEWLNICEMFVGLSHGVFATPTVNKAACNAIVRQSSQLCRREGGGRSLETWCDDASLESRSEGSGYDGGRLLNPWKPGDVAESAHGVLHT